MILIEQILEQAASFGWIDWAATGLGLIYIILAAQNRPICWIFGILSCSLWAYASFAFYDLYLDAILQLFYVVMGFIGIYQWQFGGQQRSQLPVTELQLNQHLLWCLAGGIATFAFGYFFATYTEAAATFWDAFTTVFSIIATFLLVRRILSNWLYWLVVDTIYVGLYASRGAYLFALLMIIYLVIATRAFFLWRKELVKG